MKITKYKDQKVKDNPHNVDVRVLYDKESAQAVLIALEPGEGLIPHKTPVDVFFFVLEGNPTVHIGDENEECSTDMLVESPANIVHYISNNSNRLSRILVVKAPRPISAPKVL